MSGYDRAENETEDMTQQDPNMTEQSDQSGQFGGQPSQQDMQTAQNTVGQQGGYQDQDQGGYDQNQNY